MKILLLWPKFPATFWSFKSALPFIAKKAALPPLGLLTVASLLPQDWEKKLIDLNIENLKDKDILWADFVFISAMAIQKDSVMELIDAAKKFDKKIAAGLFLPPTTKIFQKTSIILFWTKGRKPYPCF